MRPCAVFALAALTQGLACAAHPAAETASPPLADHPPRSDEPGATDITAFRGQLMCDSVPTALCRGLAAFSGGRPPDGRPQAVALVGVSAILPRPGSSDEGKPPAYEASYLVLSDSGARYGSVRPTTDAERRDALAVVQAILAGHPPPDNDAVTFARSRTGVEPATRTSHSLEWTGATHGFVRDTAEGLVVIETAPDLLAVGLFPR